MTKETIPVKGMSCSHCEARVTAAVEGMEGVKSCKASAKKSSVTVKFDPQITGIDAIKVTIREAGYEA